VDRSSGSEWGNPFEVGVDGTRDQCCDLHEQCLMEQPQMLDRIEELRGKALGCWCAPKRCHADALVVLLDVVRRR
jgi:hypothetical protein